MYVCVLCICVNIWVCVHGCVCRPTHMDMHTWKSELAMTVFPLSTWIIKTDPESSSKLSLGMQHWTETHIQGATIQIPSPHGTLPIVHLVSLQHPCKHDRYSTSLCITALFSSQRAWVKPQDDSLWTFFPWPKCMCAVCLPQRPSVLRLPSLSVTSSSSKMTRLCLLCR